MIFAILCLLAAAVAGFAYTKARAGQGKALAGAKKLQALGQAQEQSAETDSPLENMKPGGVLQLQNVGLTSQTVDAQVTDCHLHKEGSARWTEYEAVTASGKVFITVQREEELQVGISLAQLGVEELGLAASELFEDSDELVELTYEGTRFALEACGRAQYCPKGNELEAESYQYWEYESTDDDFQTLTVVKWQDGSAEAFYGASVAVDNVTVYSTS